ncbi:hypothetical protein KJ359_009478 [Pestalotiopsis sp. 9143b]|nr:hypothetical protein KJ359_009478 [Pestalotiopsis sp. 9143b]
MVISTILLAARFYAQLVVSKQRHLVDLMALVSYVFFLAIVVGTLQGLSSGPGLFVHQWNLRARNFKRFLYTVFIGTNFYGAGMLLLKTAILWEWMRIFVPLKTRNGFYWSCLAMLIINAIFYIVCIILSCLACSPFARNWDKTLAGHCIDVTLINISSAAVNFVIDLTILLLPQKVLWGLQISKRKKVGVSALFAVGALDLA